MITLLHTLRRHQTKCCVRQHTRNSELFAFEQRQLRMRPSMRPYGDLNIGGQFHPLSGSGTARACAGPAADPLPQVWISRSPTGTAPLVGRPHRNAERPDTVPVCLVPVPPVVAI